MSALVASVTIGVGISDADYAEGPGSGEYQIDGLVGPSDEDSGVVYAITRVGDRVFVGGLFDGPFKGSKSNPDVLPQPNLAAFNASTGVFEPAFSPSIDGTVETLTASPDGSVLYVGGHFTTVNGVTRKGIVALDPATGATVAGFTAFINSGVVYSIDVQNDKVYVGGKFTKMNNVTGYKHLVRVEAATGDLDLTWNPQLDLRVDDVAVRPDGERVYAVGKFTTINGVATGGAAGLDTITGALDPNFSSLPINLARAVDATNDRVVINHRNVNFVSIYNTDGTLIRRLKGDGDMQHAEIIGRRVMIGSHSMAFEGAPMVRLQSIFLDDATLPTTFNTPVYGWPAVFAIYASGQDLWLGGDFHRVGDQNASNLAKVGIDPTQTGPTVPTGVTATAISASQIDVSWTAATDDTGIRGYRILRGSEQVDFVTSGTTWSDTSVITGVAYQYHVEAIDLDDNLSVRSGGAIAVPGPDTTAPGAPGAPVVDAVTATTIDLSWPHAVDNVGIDYYEVFRDGVLVHTTTGPVNNFADTGLDPDTTYSYVVRAYDLFGLVSPDSAATAGTTAISPESPTAPTGVTVLATTETTVDLTWTASTDDVAVDHYDILRDGVVIGSTPDASVTFTDTGLDPNTLYEYTIRAVDGDANASPLSDPPVGASTLSDNTNPSAPGTPVVDAVTETTVDLSWPASNDNVAVTDYEILRDDDGPGGADPVVVGTTGGPTTTFTDTGLAPETTYDYTVRAIDGSGNASPESFSVPATTAAPSAIPTAPTDVTVATTTETTVELSWTASTDDVAVDHYDILRDGVVIGSTPDDSVTFTDIELDPDTTYSYTVRAVDGDTNASDESDPAVDGTTLADVEAPTAPGAATLVTATETSLDITWTDSTDNVAVDHYDIYRDDDGPGGADPVLVGSTIDASLTFVDDNGGLGLDPATDYTYEIKAVDAAGNASEPSPSSVLSTIDTTPPDAPDTPVVDGVTQTTVDLSWPPSTDNVAVTGYEILRGADGVIGTVDAPTTTFTDTGLTDNTVYEYTIRAIDAAGNTSAESVSVPATTDGAPEIPTVPTDVIVVTTTETTVELSWTASTDDVAVDHYDIVRDGVVIGSTADDSVTFTDTGLTPDTTYSYTIQAVDADDNTSAPSDPAVDGTTLPDTTDPTAPGAPTLVTATEVTLEITWPPASDDIAVDHYEIWRFGGLVGTTSDDTPGFLDDDGGNGLTPGTPYDYEIKAVDAAGNTSPLSPIATISTIDSADTTPPSDPGAPTLITATDTTLDIEWPPSTDNDGVDHYLIFRDGVLIGATPDDTPMFLDDDGGNGLTPSTTYEYKVRAIDAAGNRSNRSPAGSFTTTSDVDDVFDPDGNVDWPAANASVTTTPVSFRGSANDNIAVASVQVAIKNLTPGDPNYKKWLDPDLATWDGFTKIDTNLSDPGSPATTWNLDVALADGEYGFSTITVDQSGNHDQSKPWVKFSVAADDGVGPDTENPVAAVTSPGASVSGPTVLFEGTATDNVDIDSVRLVIFDRVARDYLRRDGSFGAHQWIAADLAAPNAAVTDWSSALNLPPSDYWVRVIAYDAAGNRNNPRPKVFFTVS